MIRTFAIIALVALITFPAAAEEAATEDATTTKYTAKELEEIVGPVALYPDQVLSSVLPATTVPMDIVKGCIKGCVFGLSISTLSCYRGYFAAGGAKGVGEATTSAVVMSSISILVLNYFLDLVLWPTGG